VVIFRQFTCPRGNSTRCLTQQRSSFKVIRRHSILRGRFINLPVFQTCLSDILLLQWEIHIIQRSTDLNQYWWVELSQSVQERMINSAAHLVGADPSEFENPIESNFNGAIVLSYDNYPAIKRCKC
jgi:hypothetical protein